MPALRQAWLIFRPASRSAWKSRRIAAIWSGLGRFRMGRSLALCQLYDSHYGWTRIWGAGHLTFSPHYFVLVFGSPLPLSRRSETSIPAPRSSYMVAEFWVVSQC